MTNSLIRMAMACLASLWLAGAALAAESGVPLQHSGVSLDDRASLQRGAALYMNYCSGCHSLKYLRYSRMATDLGLSEDEVMNSLNFTGAKFGDHIQVAMPANRSKEWFGNQPPDLSLVARSRGEDWLFTYLKSFYLDESRPLGWNNTVFPNVSMPNSLWELQGLQHATYVAKQPNGKDKDGNVIMACPHGAVDAETRCIQSLAVSRPGRQTPEEYDRTVRDISAFLVYAAEPAGLKRQSIGVWVLAFLALFTLLAWLLEREYWRDVD